MKNTSTCYLFVSTILISCLFACNAPVAEKESVNLDEAKAEIQALEDAYAVAQNAKDAEAVVAYYSDDAVNMPDGKPIIVGKDNILASIKKDMESDTSSVTYTASFKVEEIYAAGELLVEAGSSTHTGSDGKKTTGKYMCVFEKRDGKYICVRDIWNSDSKKEDEKKED
jgi:ketosteroid isomerase-like protein